MAIDSPHLADLAQASMLMGRDGRFPRRCYVFAALLAAAHLALAWRGLEAEGLFGKRGSRLGLEM